MLKIYNAKQWGGKVKTNRFPDIYFHDNITYWLAYDRYINADFDYFKKPESQRLLANARDDVANPQLFIDINILLSSVNLLSGAHGLSEKHVDAAVAAMIGLGSDPNQSYFTASRLAQIIELLLDLNHTVRAYKIGATSDSFILKHLGVNDAARARYLFSRGHLFYFQSKFRDAVESYRASIAIQKNLQIPEAEKAIWTAYPIIYAALVSLYAGDIAQSRSLIKSHRYIREKKHEQTKGAFSSLPEFYLAIVDCLIDVSGGKTCDDGWTPLFEAHPNWARMEIEKSGLHIYAPFALALRNPKANGSKFQDAARRWIDRFEKKFGEVQGAFPLPSVIEKIVVGAAVASDVDTSPHATELMLRSAEVLRRDVNFAISDALTAIAPFSDGEARRAARRLTRLNKQQSHFEVLQIGTLLESMSAQLTGTPPTSKRRHFHQKESYRTILNDREAMRAFLKRYDGSDRQIALVPKLADIQRVLSGNEALVVHVNSWGWLRKICITRNSAMSVRQRIDTDTQNQLTLDVKLLNAALTATHAPSPVLDSQFPAKSAVRLYETYLGGLEECVPPGTHIILAGGQSLAGIPLHALLSEIPPKSQSGYDLSQAKWLALDYHFSNLHSASAFLASRRIGSRFAADKQFLGIGDPVLGRRIAGRQTGSDILARRSIAAANGSIAALEELPETANELKAIAALFEDSKILLRNDASEERVRLETLSRYNTISFATHGLIKGDVEGLKEAALVLTPEFGGHADSQNDGLLTSSELADLDLNARLVVLSACNTSNFDADIFTSEVRGLTMALALAGVPTVIASVWPVESVTSKHLMVNLFRELTKSEPQTVAGAFSSALKTLFNDASSPHVYHPRFWAPFVVMGDGAVRLKANKTANVASAFDHPSVSPRTGEILQIVPADDRSYFVSAIGDWNGRRMASILQRRRANGSVVWEKVDHQHGGGAIAASSDAVFALTYLSAGGDKVTRPYVRKFSTDGGLLWEREIILENDSVIGLELVVDSGHTLFAVLKSSQRTPEGHRQQHLTIVKLTTDGDEIKRMKIPQPTVTNAKAILTSDGLIVATNAQDAKSSKRLYRDGFGLTYHCSVAGSAQILQINPLTMKVKKQVVIPSISINKLFMERETPMFAGWTTSQCERKPTAIVGSLTPTLDHQIRWLDRSPFGTQAVAAFSSGDRLLVLGLSDQTTSIERRATAQSIAPTSDASSYNPRRKGTESYSLREAFLVQVEPSGVFGKKDYFATGSLTHIRDAAANNGLVAGGSLGGTMLWLRLTKE